MKKQLLLGLMAMTLPWTSWAQDTPTKEKIDATYEKSVDYAGKNTKGNVRITLKAGDTPLEEGKDYWLSSKLNGQDLPGYGTIHDAGNYTVSVTLSPIYSGDYECEDLIFTVEQYKVPAATVTANTEDVTVSYGDELDIEQLITVNKGLLAPNDDAEAELKDFLSGLQVVAVGESAGKDITEVGTYSVAVDGKAENKSNYIYKRPENGTTVKLVIGKKQLYVTLEGKIYNTYAIVTDVIAPNKTYKLYMDEETTTEVEKELAGKLDITFTYDEVDNEGIKNVAPMDAGTYSIRAEITGGDESIHYTLGDGAVNYALADYEIEKAELTITANDLAALTKTYGEKDPDLTELFTYKRTTGNNPATLDVKGDEFKAIGLKMVRDEGEDVFKADGKTKATYAIKPSPESETKNYKIVYYAGKNDKKPTFTITPRSLGKGLDATTGIKLNEPEKKAVTYSGKDFVETFSSEAVPELILTDNGLEITNPKTELEEDIDYEFIVSAANQDDNKADEAGELFNVTLMGKGNYTGYLWSLNYKIEKAELTIEKTDDSKLSLVHQEGKNGSGDLSEYFTFTGLVEADKDENDKPKDGWLTLEAYTGQVNTDIPVNVYTNYGKKLISSSEYLSTDPEEGLKNYTLKYAPQATLDVLAADGFVLDYFAVRTSETEEDVMTKIETYNGKEVNVTVTNRELEADRWYAMVLPFDIKVSEISKAFTNNYAVVNVPNEAVTDAVAFKLHVGNIEANTLFLIKLEDAWKKTEENETAAIDFGSRKIVNGGADCVVKAGDNEFHGVYELATLSDATEWYLQSNSSAPEKNKFYNAGAQENGVKVSPLGGYVKTPAGAAARIYVEEADGSTTAINAITGEVINNAEGWYSIDGMKLNAQPTQKGVYINNGKKVVIK